MNTAEYFDRITKGVRGIEEEVQCAMIVCVCRIVCVRLRALYRARVRVRLSEHMPVSISLPFSVFVRTFL